MKKVSIIIPVYNVEKYIGECLDSIVKQTYRNLEIILVDDGSPDNSGSVCDKYADKDERVRVIHKKNAGVSEARNSGLEIATGDYIAFADPDDWLEKDMIEKMVRALEYTDADASFCRFHTEILSDEALKYCSPVEEKTGDSNNAIWHMFETLAYGVMVWNKLFKREIIYGLDNSFIKFDKNLKVGEDEIWLIEVVQNAKKVAYINDELYYWRVREESVYRNNLITEARVQDVEAQTRALEILNDDEAPVYWEIYNRLNCKIYDFAVKAYINNQTDYYNIFMEYKNKYSADWFKSDRVMLQTKIKRKIIYFLMNHNTSVQVVEKLYKV